MRILSFGCRNSLRTGDQPLKFEDSGDAERVLRNRQHLGERAKAFPGTWNRILPKMVGEDGWVATKRQ